MIAAMIVAASTVAIVAIAAVVIVALIALIYIVPRSDRRPSGISSPTRQFGTALLSVGGSAGTPSVVSSLNRNPAIRSSYPPGAGRRVELN
jgi:hypothetical protein